MRLGVMLCLIIFLPALPVLAQGSDLKETSPPVQRSEVEALRQELEEARAALRELREEIRQLRDSTPPVAIIGGTPLTAGAGEGRMTQVGSSATGPTTQAKGEKEIELSAVPEARPGLLPEFLKTRIGAFLVGSFSFNSHLQMVPEFAGGIPAKADPGRSNFRFDKLGLTFTTTFAQWLQASGVIEVESHRDRHTHGFDPDFGCPDTGPCIERFGAEQAETEVALEKFNLAAVAPVGNGLTLSVGRFDVPFGIERHDEPLILTATTSEVFRFGRPQLMTGFQASYPFAPWLDVSAWVVNRWESETVEEEEDFNDNNKDKSFGGRIGFTPFPHEGLLNVGIGGFYGPEQQDNNSNKRWVVDLDFTWTPLPRLLFAGELIYGGEANRELRERGLPFPAPEEVKNVNWRGFYLLTHYDALDWLGLSFRWGLFDDMDGGRTGVKQVLQSWTFAPIVHLSRLIPELRPTGAAYARTRHPIDWVDLKIEYRLNHSNRPVFSEKGPGEDILEANKTSHQVELQLVVNFWNFL